MRTGKTQGSFEYIDPDNCTTLIAETASHTSFHRIFVHRFEGIFPCLTDEDNHHDANHLDFLYNNIFPFTVFVQICQQ